MYSVASYSQIPFSDEGSISVIVAVSGVSATGAVGTVIAGQFVTVLPSGVQGTSGVGTVVVLHNGVFIPSGVSATITIGPYSISAIANVTIVEPGVSSTGQVGTVTLSTDQIISVTGVEGAGSVNSIIPHTAQVLSVTGLSSTGQIGTGTVIKLGCTVFPTGVNSTGQIGTVSVSLSAVASPTGVSAIGYTSGILIWSVVDTNQTPPAPNWKEIAA